MKQNKLVYGVGINDADYKVHLVDASGKVLWRCPFYDKWCGMLKRCYSEAYQKDRPSYVGCTVIQEWLTFSSFSQWMQAQDWQDNDLDKDLLISGNKEYGPSTCLFIPQRVNSFLLERTASRGEWPIGVTYHKGDKKFQASCKDVVTGKHKYLGSYINPEEAHQAWLSYKLEQAKLLANTLSDKRLAAVLVEKYSSY